MPRFAANLTMMFNEHAFLDRFQAAADAGFDTVEFLFPYDHPAETIAGLLERCGLRLALFNMPPGDWQVGERGLACLPGRQAEFRRSVAQALAYADVLGTPLVHMMAGLGESSDPEVAALYRDAVSFAADAAAKQGIAVTIEPINPRDMPGYFLNDFYQAIRLIEELAHPALRLHFDIYHRQIIHGDVLTGLRAALPLIGHIQIASVPDRHEPVTGELDDVFLFSALDAMGYDGAVGCEYRPANGTVAGLSWLERVRQRSA